MNPLLKNIPFQPKNDCSKFNNFEQEYINISDRDT
ncbi:hypothetical protein LCGC14_3056320, partial [marine sediment metagenome]